MNEYQAVAFSHETMLVGESPLWHPAEQTLYWVDIEGFAIHRLQPATGQHRKWPMASEPSALAICDGGGLLVATRAGFMHLDTEDGMLKAVAPAPYDTATTRFNDGKVDAAGRFWVGTIYEPRDKQAAEMFVLERGAVRKAWSGGMTNSNGLAFSPDGSVMYHADTAAHRVTRYAYDLASGTPSDPQVLAQFSADKTNNYGGRPDGATVDSEGNYWLAMFEGGRVVKLSPQGELLDQIALPVRCPTMVTFGGEDLKTLYITSAGKRPAEELAQYPLSGRVLQVRVKVAGLAPQVYIS
ncbi:SMP-30/gluconolactonase/LRE family protein [Pseudoduganella sp. LjRoot289]|uniref:SMP-30/gluconolactonase/LRE family protein n=1 Tax=Pseudoduganella sp. LjRoot289 TaxID=3342314 RepID=UPI003ED12170